MLIHTSVADFRQWRMGRHGRCVAVFTMGALHEGHAALARRARELAGPDGTVVATLFVNPTQFESDADLASYPRTLDSDTALLERLSVDAVLVPTADDMYGPERAVSVDPGPLGAVLEGRSRPGHFSGVLTVVAKLLHITSPDTALFGEKDYQQLTLIRRMVRDLDFSVDVVGVPTVRDDTGLALSSRNARLSVEGRLTAAALPEVLIGVVAGLRDGMSLQHVLDAAHTRLHARGVTEVDYLVVTGADLGPVPSSGIGRVLVAATIEGVRLIDNMEVGL